MVEIQVFEDGDELYVDSRLIAPRLGIDHGNFLETIEKYQTEAEKDFGIIPFETEKTGKPGRPQKYALLNEDNSLFMITLSRNSPEVVQCKRELVKAFAEAKRHLQERQFRQQHVPYWYERMRIALSDTVKPLQMDYFCVYREMMDFFCELENRFGYVISDIDEETGKRLVPDISIAQKFNQFMRSEDEIPSQARQYFLDSSKPVDFRQPGKRKHGWFDGGANHTEIQMYNHVYPESSHGKYNVHPAMSYPDEYRSIFRYYLQEHWITDFCVPYLQKRDPMGLQVMRAQMLRMSPAERQAIATTLVGRLLPSLPESA